MVLGKLGPVCAHLGMKCIDEWLSRTWKSENNSSNSIVYDFMLANLCTCTNCYVKESAIHKDFNL